MPAPISIQWGQRITGSYLNPYGHLTKPENAPQVQSIFRGLQGMLQPDPAPPTNSDGILEALNARYGPANTLSFLDEAVRALSGPLESSLRTPIIAQNLPAASEGLWAAAEAPTRYIRNGREYVVSRAASLGDRAYLAVRGTAANATESWRGLTLLKRTGIVGGVLGALAALVAIPLAIVFTRSRSEPPSTAPAPQSEAAAQTANPAGVVQSALGLAPGSGRGQRTSAAQALVGLAAVAAVIGGIVYAFAG